MMNLKLNVERLSNTIFITYFCIDHAHCLLPKTSLELRKYIHFSTQLKIIPRSTKNEHNEKIHHVKESLRKTCKQFNRKQFSRIYDWQQGKRRTAIHFYLTSRISLSGKEDDAFTVFHIITNVNVSNQYGIRLSKPGISNKNLKSGILNITLEC